MEPVRKYNRREKLWAAWTFISNFLELRIFHLSSRNILDPRDRNNCFYILRCVRNGLYIHNLYLGTRDLGPKDATQIEAALKATKSLETLTLCTICCKNYFCSIGNNDLGPEGAKCIANALKENASVTQLNFGSNKLKTEGAVAIAEALKNNTTLLKLDLSMDFRHHSPDKRCD